MIRNATLSDIPRLLDMGDRFADRARLADHVGWDRESGEKTFRYLIESPDGVLVISDDGAAGGLAHPHPFNLSMRVGQEMFWWSEGKGGLALLTALEDEARSIGVLYWTMITLEAIRPQATGKLYQRRGYTPLEHSYIKRL